MIYLSNGAGFVPSTVPVPSGIEFYAGNGWEWLSFPFQQVLRGYLNPKTHQEVI